MSDKDYTLASGAKLHVSTASFEDANALVKALTRCAKGLAISDDPLKADIGVLKDVLVEAISSDEVERALFKCMERVSYKDIKVSKALFDDPTIGDHAREDYFEICWKTVEANCGPFFVKAFSAFKVRMASVPNSPKSP